MTRELPIKCDKEHDEQIFLKNKWQYAAKGVKIDT